MGLKSKLLNNLKNIVGWKTNRKLVVISVDDYGNVRLDSKRAREKMDEAGLKVKSRFDAFDTLETREDLENLYEVLGSVKDKNGHHAVFTPFALPCNINFERVVESDFSGYWQETLLETYTKLAASQPDAYEGTWELWKEGIARGIMKPEFHGREHFNLIVIEEKLAKKDPDLLVSLYNRSLANIGPSGYSSIGWTAAFSFWDPMKDTFRFPQIIQEGLDAFEKVFGYQARVFTPPAQQFPTHLEGELINFGLKALDRPFYQAKHLGFGKYKKQISTMGYKKDKKMVETVRNVVFEPTDGTIDHVSKAIQQIEAAFFWNRPAIISSHRVNFCGHIDPKNREKGLGDLKKLLQAIVIKWPEVEFVSARELVDIIECESRGQN